MQVAQGRSRLRLAITVNEPSPGVCLGSQLPTRACSPAGIEMMRPSLMPPLPTTRMMPMRPLGLSCRLLRSNCIRIQRSGFSTLGRRGQNDRHTNNQDAEYCLDFHRRLPVLRLSRLTNSIDLRFLSGCEKRTSALIRIPDSSRTPREVRKVPLSEVAAPIRSSERTNEMGRLPIDYRSRSLLVCDTA
jgi:hypothetical protein